MAEEEAKDRCRGERKPSSSPSLVSLTSPFLPGPLRGRSWGRAVLAEVERVENEVDVEEEEKESTAAEVVAGVEPNDEEDEARGGGGRPMGGRMEKSGPEEASWCAPGWE